MNRAMFSGVAGLKVHQTRMDVIGNNIANVNTYGYKSQRAVFSDIFYQTLRGASQGTNSRGGVNPTTVGYGAMLAGIQTMMTQSSMQNTGFGLDVAITGEGFLQVMDADGNVFYTRAGMLDYDSAGNLVDINGYFVLGSRDLNGTDGTQKINLVDPLGSVPAGPPTASQTINGVTYTLTGSNNSKYGNVGVTFSAEDLSFNEDNQLAKAKAIISATGSIEVKLNKYATFKDLGELISAINAAISEEVKNTTGASEHIAGIFTLTMTDAETGAPADAAAFAAGPLTGAEIADASFNVKPGTISGFPTSGVAGFNLKEVNTGFAGEGDVTDFYLKYENYIPTEYDTGVPPNVVTPGSGPEGWRVVMTIDGRDYTCFVPNDGTVIGSSILMTGSNGGSDSFTLTFPGLTALTARNETINGNNPPVIDEDMIDLTDPAHVGLNVFDVATAVAKPSEPSRNLGLGSVSFSLDSATEGGKITPDQLTGITVGADGAVYVSHADLGTIAVGKIMLANFANPRGLQQAGSNYYKETPNSGKAQYCDPGSDGTGALKASTLEMSNVDLSDQFVDMIVTQRGFQANSRIITVSDTMLEELINLKR